jgi:DNA (cytosine-5)-methyltransferase 1
MQAAGWPVELAWYAETDPDASTVLAAHHPGVLNVGDVTTAQFAACEPVDVIAAGYPCQPFSAAGKRQGMDDERWIWPDVARAVRVVRPRWVLLENVRGHLVWGASRVVADLAGLGYVGSWTCVRASDVGAPHRRERLFILAADADRDPVRAEPVAVGARHGATVAGDDRQGVLALLPTPAARLADKRGMPSRETAEERMHVEGRRNLEDAVALLPTPAARDSGRGAGWGDQPGRPLSETIHRLLPTPRASDGRHGGPGQRSGYGRTDLALPSTVVQDAGHWGRYTPAVARWETMLGRPAPNPTEPGTRGQPRLSARFVEWLMGLPPGYVTDHVGRNAALRILGNGVVPQQGAYALHHLHHLYPPGAAVPPTKTGGAR